MEKKSYDLCGEVNPNPTPEIDHYCTLPKGHEGEWHIATIGPAEWNGTELSRWRVNASSNRSSNQGLENPE